MNRFQYFLIIFALCCLGTADVTAGNPDRQGEAGAPELLMVPYARLAGLHAMSTSLTKGVEAMRLNVAGVGRINKTEFVASYGIYLQGTGVNMNGFGFAQRIGENGAIGVSLMALDFGENMVTTVAQPEGTGATFSPSYFNIGVGYSHVFANKISVGILFRGISERISDLSANSFAIDAGVQYVTGESDNFKFGISLRNIGPSMQYEGEGLSFTTEIPFEGSTYGTAVNNRPLQYELQSVLNIGASYDFLLGGKSRLTLLANFASNSFSQDQVGGGLEFAFNDMFMLRGGYRYDFGQTAADGVSQPIYSGPCGGVSIEVPVGEDTEDKKATRFGVDYAYRASNLFSGSHNIGIRLSF
ncbi:MAG: PorV/PorQ family protein [Phaeodactylibacter sp.]|nr:PorV/PorQ family protein [Phaeodactylibacter sp.]